MFVSASIGLTLKLRKDSQYEFIRPSVEFIMLNTDEETQPQLEAAKKGFKELWNVVTDEVSQEILSQMGELDQEMQMQVTRKLKAMEGAIAELKDKMSKKSSKQS